MLSVNRAWIQYDIIYIDPLTSLTAKTYQKDFNIGDSKQEFIQKLKW